MDIASVIGLVLCFVMVIFGILSNAGVGGLPSFVDVPSAIITFGGAFSAILASKTMADFVGGLKSFALVIKPVSFDVTAIIRKIIDLSNIARKEGLLALEEAANGIEDEFLKKGVMLVVDGTDPELVRGIMEADLMCVEARHKTNIGFWDKWAALGPAWGMIGTLIGLINMLKLMDDPSTVGPSMAIALITTLYGSIIANWLCTPTSAKLKVNNDTEIMIKEVTVEGLLSIQAGENPRVIEEKLKSFLSPKMRENMLEQGGGEE